MASKVATGEEPLVLVTRQGRARARLWIANPGEASRRLKSADLEGLPGEVALSPGRLGAVQVAGRVPPGRIARVAVSLRLEPGTPVGTYPATLLLEDQRIPVRIVVPEERRLRITPSSFQLEVESGTEVEQLITVENVGNVAVTLDDPAPVVLERHDRFHELLRDALNRTVVEDYEQFLNSLVGRAKEMVAGDRDRLVLAKAVERPTQLLPGRSVVLCVRWQVPGPLERGQWFAADLNIAGESVRLEVRRPLHRARTGKSKPTNEG